MSGGQAFASLAIGFVGKRELGAGEDAVARALADAFDLLDKRFPHSPKILLNALAAGADMIAARDVLARASWTVVAPLPLPPALYAEDFDEAGQDALKEFLHQEKVRPHVMQPLLSPSSGVPFNPEDLHRSQDRHNSWRTDHYEQSGLFIAQYSVLLIAVMDAGEKPGRVGGTARIVQSRLTGQFDDKAQDVIRCSRMLLTTGLLEAHLGAPVWRIEPAEGGSGFGEERSFEVLLPPSQLVARLSQNEKMKASLRLCDRIEDYNSRCRKLSYNERKDIQSRAAVTDGPSKLLLQQRLALSVIQQKMKAAVGSTARALAALFVLAVLAFEIYVAVFSEPLGWIALAANIVVVAAVFTLHRIARKRRWTNYAEDYRAVSEALRVQIARWDAGLRSSNDRVDCSYLRDALGSRSLVRAAVTSLINAAILAGGEPTGPFRLDEVEKNWVKGQQSFFESRARERETSLAWVEFSSWTLFFGAVGLGFCLLVFTFPGDEWGGWLRHWCHIGFIAVLAVAILGMTGLLALKKFHKVVLTNAKAKRRLGAAVGGLLGFLGGGWVYGMLGIGATQFQAEAAHHLIIVLSVLLTAMAGAIRYVSEKLSWEAEWRSYEEAAALFSLATSRLREDSSLNPDESRDKWLELIRELGSKALEENEAWLRAHRDRPLEPVLGG